MKKIDKLLEELCRLTDMTAQSQEELQQRIEVMENVLQNMKTECLPKFKKGDIIVHDNTFKTIILFKGTGPENEMYNYVCYDIITDYLSTTGLVSDKNHFGYLDKYKRLATDDEVALLEAKMRENGYYYDKNKGEVLPYFNDGDIVVSDWGIHTTIGVARGGYDGPDYNLPTYFVVYLTTDNCKFYPSQIGTVEKRRDRRPYPEELEALDKILKANKRKWNPKTKQLETTTLQRVKKDEIFFYITADLINSDSIFGTTDTYCSYYDYLFEYGNYFHTREEAEKFVEEKIRPLFKARKS